jgi:hypothetical protein
VAVIPDVIPDVIGAAGYRGLIRDRNDEKGSSLTFTGTPVDGFFIGNFEIHLLLWEA